MKYIALLTGNRREVYTSSPKVLLTRVRKIDGKEFRDHCWISLSSKIEKIMPKGHKKPIKVEIIADTIEYLRRGVEQSMTLKIKKIQRIK